MAKNQAITRNLAEAQETTVHNFVPEPDNLIFSLYTEDMPNLASIVTQYFDGATIYSARGIWRGTSEASAVVEIIAPSTARQQVIALAKHIKAANHQTAIMVDERPARMRIL